MTIEELENYSPSSFFHDVRSQLKEFIYNRSNEAFTYGDAARDAISDIEELEARRTCMLERFIHSMGGLPPSDTPLNAKVMGAVECEGYRIEKIIFESRPKTFVTANLYVPGGIKSPRGAVLFVCGHHEKAKHEDEYQIVCQYLVNAGLLVLAQDPIGQGERFSYFEKSLNDTTIRWGTFEHDYVGSQSWSLGDGLARYFVHDAMRGIDYLCSRPEVDSARIGVTGNSGGGTQTSLMMICDSRIAAAAPATFIMNRQTNMYTGMAQDSEQVWPGMTAIGFDHEDILLMMAPRPVLVLAVKSDFFPIEGTRRTVERTKRFWEMYGMDTSIQLFEDDSDHHYTRPMAKEAANFFSRYLLEHNEESNDFSLPSDEAIKPLAPFLLWCTKSGQIRGEIEGARSVIDENQDRLVEIERQRNAIPENVRKEKAMKWLRERVFNSRKTCSLNPRHFSIEKVDDLIVQMSIWWTQEGIFNHAFVFKDYRFAGQELPVTIAVWDGGTNCIKPHIRWIRETCNKGRAVLVLDVSGVGALMPNQLNDYPIFDFYGVIFKLTHDLMWLDDSIAAMRTHDVLRAVDAVELFRGINKEDIQFYANGHQGLYAQLAAVLDSRVKSCEVVNGMGSFASWVDKRHYAHYDIMSIVLPGVLKYFDLPDLEKWS